MQTYINTNENILKLLICVYSHIHILIKDANDKIKWNYWTCKLNCVIKKIFPCMPNSKLYDFV